MAEEHRGRGRPVAQSSWPSCLIFWFLGIRAAILWAVLMAFLSLLPAVGVARLPIFRRAIMRRGKRAGVKSRTVSIDQWRTYAYRRGKRDLPTGVTDRAMQAWYPPSIA
jgi:hypothetical protein